MHEEIAPRKFWRVFVTINATPVLCVNQTVREGGHRRVVLDESGDRVTTVQLSDRMRGWMGDGRERWHRPDGQLQTPLATLHAFNGWADMFLTTPANGLQDLYFRASYTLPMDFIEFRSLTGIVTPTPTFLAIFTTSGS